MSDGGSTSNANVKAKANLTPKSDTKPVELKVTCPTPDEVKITFASGANSAAMTETALKVLKEICSAACVAGAQVTSTARTAKDQARIMHNVIKEQGVSSAKALYGGAGEKVISAYVESTKDGKTSSETEAAMLAKIEEVGPTKVSNHVVGSDGKSCVFDVSPKSIGNDAAKKRFSVAMKAHKSVQRSFEPPKDKAFHIEVKN